MLKAVTIPVAIKRTIPVFVIIALIYALLSFLNANKPEPKERVAREKRTQVFVQNVGVGTKQMQVIAQGMATPKSEIQLKARVEGLVVAIADSFVNGGQITKGQVLVQLEDSDYKHSVVQAKARVAQAMEKYTKAKAQAQSAQRELSELGRDSASELAKGIPQLNFAKADLDSAKASLAKAELDLSRTQIKAPFNGIVAKETISLGQLVSRNNTIGSIFATDVMEVSLALSLSDMDLIGLPLNYVRGNSSNVDNSQIFNVELYANMGSNNAVWQGQVARSGGMINSQTRTVNVVVDVKDPYGFDNQQSNFTPLLSGLFVNAKIKGKSIENVALIPKKALRNKNQVWLVGEERRLAVADVKVINRNDGLVWVHGLEHNSKVITSSLPVAAVGMSLRPTNERLVAQLDENIGSEEEQIIPEHKEKHFKKGDRDKGDRAIKRGLRNGNIAGGGL